MAVTDSEWKSWEGFSRYEASDRGPIRNATTGLVMSTYPDKDGYRRLTLVNDDGKKVNVSRARCVLTAHAGPCPEGMETCHGPGGRDDDRYPENIRWGTKPENERDKAAAGTSPRPNPTYPCKDGCGNLVIHEDRRCVECVGRVKTETVAMLARGENLYDIADHFGYSGVEWVWRLAVEGGCTLTKREALTQQPPLSRRVTATVRGRLRRARLAVTHRDG
jgi:hypothetical protein